MSMTLLTMALNTALLIADDYINEGNQAEQIILPIGQQYIIDICCSEKEKISWQVTTQASGNQKIIEVDMEEEPLQTFWYHPDQAPALSIFHFTIRALSLGTAHLMIHVDPRNENNKQQGRDASRARELVFVVVN